MLVFFTIIIEALIFLIVATGTFAVVTVFERAWDQRRRLGVKSHSVQYASTPLLRQQGPQNPFFAWVESSTSLNDSEERQKLRKELAQAGFESPSAPVWFVLIRYGLAIGLPLGYLFIHALVARAGGAFGMIFFPLLLCAIGLLAPSSVISRIAETRKTALEFEFPDALDLMVVCVEAGLSLDATFVRVVQEVGESHPRIAQEFGRMSEEIHAGRVRSDALRAMADRCNVDSVKSFVALVIQSDALGSSIAQSLRTFASELRETRYLKAEERALRIPVLMTIPLTACILPVIVTAVLLPAVIDVIRLLVPALESHH